MDNSAISALWERVEIYNKMEETVSLLNPEEAAILTVYAENLLKTRPLRRPVKILAALYAPYGTKTASRPESRQVQDTNCEFCAAGYPRYADETGSWHEVSHADSGFGLEQKCEAQNAQN